MKCEAFDKTASDTGEPRDPYVTERVRAHPAQRAGRSVFRGERVAPATPCAPSTTRKPECDHGSPVSVRSSGFGSRTAASPVRRSS